MYIKFLIIFFISVGLSGLMKPVSVFSEINRVERADYNNLWKAQLNEMNFLVVKISSLNIINGLNFTRKQAEALKDLSLKMDSLKISRPEFNDNTFSDLVKVRNTYITLFDYLKNSKPISNAFKNQVVAIRLLQSEIIKKSLIGAQEAEYQGDDCLRCHAPPSHFPRQDVAEKDTIPVTPKMRKEIDNAHVYGLFQGEGTAWLLRLKGKVDTVLTDGQKSILKNFRCCLLPPDNLASPAKIGQAFVTDEWIDYFTQARRHSKKEWKNLKRLYLIPVEDILDAKMPGIRKKYKAKKIKKVEEILKEVRAMSEIDFEIRKEMVCSKLENALNVDFLGGKLERQKEQDQFIAAMFLLFYNSSDIYSEIIKQEN